MEDQDVSHQNAADEADTATASGLTEELREPLPRAAGSDRLLWTGAVVAVLAHVLPFVYFGHPDPLGEGVLTEAIAVEFIDKATFEGRDQTPPSAPAAGAPPPSPAAQMPPGPPQKPQQAVPPSPPPSPAVAARPAPETPKAEAAAPPKALPAFDGEDPAAMPKSKAESKPTKKPEDSPQPAEPKQADQPEAPQAKPRPPQPQRPPPQKAIAPRAPAPPSSAKAAAPSQSSAPALAKSGEVSKFAKEVVAALAKAKPSAPGIKGSVTVTVVVAFGGGVRTAKITGSSGRDDLDALALDAARKAKLPSPPADVSTDDLFYDVEYVFK